MLWSLAKALLFFVLLAALAWGASLLSATDGGVRVALMGKEFSLGPLQSVIAAILMFVALWVLFRITGLLIAILRFFAGDETALSRYFDRNRERRGYTALSESMMALASGEYRVALSRAAKAERLLGRPELTNLITAEAAQLSGDKSRAEEAYKALLQDDRSRFVGVRGLMKIKLDEGDHATALKLAEKAIELRPKHVETQNVLLKLQTSEHDWKGARTTLEAQRKSGALPRDVWKRRDAVLALEEAKVLLDDTASIDAQEAAIAANKASPDLIPAAAMAARSYIAKDNARAATRVLKKAWEAQPHPDLAAAFAEIDPHETPSARLKRFRDLLDIHPTQPESRMLMAELKIADGDFIGAESAIAPLVTDAPTARVMTIMAAIERGTGADDAVVRGWLARALTAPRGPQWICDKCHAIHSTWAPVCDNCGGFDTLAWTVAPESAGPSPTQTEMLPLIVGRPQTAAAEVVEPVMDLAEDDPKPPSPDESDSDDERFTTAPTPSPLTPEELARRGAF